jgi:hypothetical protein
MIGVVLVVACILTALARPLSAGENSSAKLAMHVLASSSYLDCTSLSPSTCDSINVDVSVSEILSAGGYGHVVFLAHDIYGMTGAEFRIDGWPTGRGVPQLVGPEWCPDGVLTMGDHLGTGGITVFPCVNASEGGLVVIGYCSFGPLAGQDMPITLEYAPSDFSDPANPHNYVLDCTVDHQEDITVASTGCTIGGTHAENPDCSGDAGGGDAGEGQLPCGGSGSAEGGDADDGSAARWSWIHPDTLECRFPSVGISGTVQEASTGQPLAGVRIIVAPEGQPPVPNEPTGQIQVGDEVFVLPSVGRVSFRALSSPSGEFEVTGIPHQFAEGPFLLLAYKRGYEPITVHGLAPSTGEQGLSAVTLVLQGVPDE